MSNVPLSTTLQIVFSVFFSLDFLGAPALVGREFIQVRAHDPPAACPHPRRLPLGGPSFQSVCVC